MKYEHYTLGLNPDHEDGLWPTEEAALQGFANQFCMAMQAAQGRNVYVRIAPKVEKLAAFEGNWTSYKIIGRFSVEVQEENMPPETGFGFV